MWNKIREFFGFCPHNWSKWEIKKIFMNPFRVVKTNSTRFCCKCGEFQSKTES